MNNFTFGNARHQYYETICGGAGAGPGFARRERRAHAHDELAPHGSRGARAALPGAHRAGSRSAAAPAARAAGAAATASCARSSSSSRCTRAILSNRRRVAPAGLAGGAPGALRPQLRAARATGASRSSARRPTVELAAGDRFVIETPGGGGYGRELAQPRCRSASRTGRTSVVRLAA